MYPTGAVQTGRDGTGWNEPNHGWRGGRRFAFSKDGIGRQAHPPLGLFRAGARGDLKERVRSPIDLNPLASVQWSAMDDVSNGWCNAMRYYKHLCATLLDVWTGGSRLRARLEVDRVRIELTYRRCWKFIDN